MKISRKLLKEIVKEALIEILADGLGPALNEATQRRSSQEDDLLVSRPVRSAVRQFPQPPRKKDPVLDRPVRASAAIESAIKEGSGGDSVLAEMLADTAKTTLPGFLAGDRASSAGQHVGVEQITHSPEEIFGEETTGKWAELAFAPRRPGIASLPPPDPS
jgi:hypothetical protein